MEPSLFPPNESEALSAGKLGSFQVGGFCTSVVMPGAEHVHGLPRAAPDGASEVSGGDALHSAGGRALSLKRPHGGSLL